MTLFDPTPATEAADEAVTRAGDHADADWWAAALGAVRAVAAGESRFTTDDVWAILANDTAAAATHEPRALGAVMREARYRGICAPTDYYQPSRRVECHARPVRVWQGLR